jgi:hypothetical protein
MLTVTVGCGTTTRLHLPPAVAGFASTASTASMDSGNAADREERNG